MNSIAIAVKQSLKKDGNNEIDNHQVNIDLHVNIWKIDSIPDIKFYIDFGIKCDFRYDKLRIYLPFELYKYKIKLEGRSEHIPFWEDYGSVIGSDNAILSALFNENMVATKPIDSCFYPVSFASEKTDATAFHIYKLANSNISFDTTTIPGGTFLNISIENVNNFKGNYYIRFRIAARNSNQITKKEALTNDLLQAAFSKMNFYDIRINEPRTLYDKAGEEISKDKYHLVRFSKVHIFYLAKYKTTVNSGSNAKVDSRIIEPNVWQKYEPREVNGSLFLAHHWKFKGKEEKEVSPQGEAENSDKENNQNPKNNVSNKISSLKSINLFFTATYPRLQIWTVLDYLFLIILCGAGGSFLVNFEKSEAPNSLNWKCWIILGMSGYISIRLLWKYVLVPLWEWIKRKCADSYNKNWKNNKN